ncbi:hypothetical protein [Allokutzneria oryzae]|uniref:Uncharacterized protein n=1 Tax=Allokutzneria oryzae TaxID=1378989 RepID=A0ABV6A731_9PSEU
MRAFPGARPNSSANPDADTATPFMIRSRAASASALLTLVYAVGRSCSVST